MTETVSSICRALYWTGWSSLRYFRGSSQRALPNTLFTEQAPQSEMRTLEEASECHIKFAVKYMFRTASYYRS